MLGWRPTAKSTWLPTTWGSPAVQSTPTATPSACGASRMHLAFDPNPDAFVLEDGADRVGYLLILAGDQARTHLDDGHQGPEPPVDLGEFKPDVAAAHHHEVSRNDVESKHSRVRQKRNCIDAGHVRHAGPAADVEEDPLCRQSIVPDADRIRRLERRGR